MAGKFVSLPEFLAKMLPDIRLPETLRRSAFEALLPPDAREQKETWFRTIETVREALIATHDDVTFLFSHLSRTPKNKILSEVFHKYLDSPLSHDRASTLWALIENLRQGFVSNLFCEEVNFVADESSSFLFRELAHAYRNASGVESVHYIETGLLGPIPPPERRTDIKSGSLATLFKHLEPLLPDQTGLSLCIHTQLKKEALEYLRSYLTYRNRPFADFTNNVMPLSAGDLWGQIRQAKMHPLKERLKFLHQMKTNRTTPEEFEKAARDFLGKPSKDRDQPQPSTVRSPEILLLPFQPVTVSQNTKLVVLADNSLWYPEVEEILFEPSEISRLVAQGFPLPNIHDIRQRRVDWLKHFRSTADTLWVTDDLASELGSILQPSPLPSRRHTEQRSENFFVQLPIKSFSATQLETYVRCPSQYFLANRLKLRSETDTENRFSLIFGVCTHNALENHFKKYSRLSTEAELLEDFKAALEKEEPPIPVDSTQGYMLLHKFKALYPKLRSIESTLEDNFGSLQRHALEEPFDINLGTLQLRGKIDRIDRDAEGNYLVLDYKTGTVVFSPSQVARGENFQAPIYLLAAEKLFGDKTLGLLFYDLKQGEIKRGILRNAHLKDPSAITRGHTLSLEAYRNLLEESEIKMGEIARQILSGDFSPTPEAGTCRSCTAGALCRRSANYV